MKNLKRVLSLALATVMLLGMMVVGANAAFADQSSIKYTEAVDMLTGLGVINGMENNTFQPNGTLTRAQAAKMVAYVKAGANEATVGYYDDGTTKFTDVKSNHAWAYGSINYCVANNIVSGVGAKTFAPDANLTGAQLAKMLLVALGYPETSQKDTETLTGPNWQVNTMRKATQAGLFKGLDSNFVASKNVTRQEASQIIYNALSANIVKVGSWDMYGNPNYIVDEGETLLTASFDVVKVTGKVNANAASGSKGTTLASVTVPTGTPAKETPTTGDVYALETGIDLLCHNVTILAKTDNNGLVRDAVTGQIQTYGYIDNASLAKTVVASDNNVAKKDAEAAGFNVASFTVTTFSKNYSTTTGALASEYAKGKSYVMISNTPDRAVTDIIEVVSTLNQIDTITTTGAGNNAKTAYAFKDTAVGTLTNTATASAVNVYSGAAAGDYVILTNVNGFYDMQKASTVNATITALNRKGSAVTGVVAGGTTYAKSGVSYTDSAITGVKDFANATLGEAVLILDGSNNLVAVTGVKAATNYAYVAKFAENNNGVGADGMPSKTLVAMIYFADGTSGAYTVDTTAIGSAAVTKDTAAGLFDVTVSANKTVVIKDIAPASKVTGITEIKKGVSKLEAVSPVYTDASSVVFVVNGTYGATGVGALSVRVFTGTANAPSLSGLDTSSNTTAVKKAGSANTVIDTMLITGKALPAADVNVYFYTGAYSLGSRMENGQVISTVTYTVYQDGTATSLTFDKSAAATLTAPGFVKVGAGDLTNASTSTDGVTAATDAAVTYFNGTLTLGGQNYVVDGSTKVVCLLADGSEYTLTQLATTTLFTKAELSVAYKEDPVTHVKTASVIYVTTVTPVTP